jgi:uncharacterized protein with ParB-like and HNH nuclease domain
MILEKDSVKIEYVNLYLLQPKKIGIPIFQRFYDWKKDQTIQLLQDITALSDNPSKDLYFLDFIFYLESDKIMIADGQQRLVTLNILFKAINDYISEKALTIPKLDLFDIEYDVADNQTKYFCNFNNYICAPFKTIYIFFKEWIDTHSGILSVIVELLKSNIRVYMKECDNADDAFVIFQQINTGGKPLSKEEIIQTAIQQYSKAYSIPISFKVKDIKLALTSYHKYITGDTSKNFDNIGIITFLKNEVTKDKDSFKKFVKTLDTLSKLENNPISSVFYWINRSSLHDVLNVLAMKGIDTIKNRDYLEKIIKIIKLQYT